VEGDVPNHCIDVTRERYEHRVCDESGYATGWEVMIAARRFQHRLEVFMDQSLEPLGLTFAQYRALEVLHANNEMHVSHLARLLRLSRRAVQLSGKKLNDGSLVDLTDEASRTYVRPSALGPRRLELSRTFTDDLKVQLEADLSTGERHRLTQLLRRADRSIQPARQPEWWLER
jgi:DNA-binding MarR family transcriptional regulator